MYLIDVSYFIKGYQVPNSAPSLDIPNNTDSFEVYIDKYARLLLQNALGHVLFDELDGYVNNGTLDGSATQQWKDLVNGKTYTLSGRSYKWRGLIYDEGAFKGSVLTPFVFYNWHLENITRQSGVGEVKGKAVNQINVDSTPTSVRAWNDYIMQYQGGFNNSYYRLSYVNGVPFHDYFGNSDNDYVSLLKFLRDNEASYPDAKCRIEPEGYNNSFGL